jgi:hypothetical protein
MKKTRFRLIVVFDLFGVDQIFQTGSEEIQGDFQETSMEIVIQGDHNSLPGKPTISKIASDTSDRRKSFL